MILFQDLIQRTAEKTGYPQSLVIHCIRHKFTWLREKLSSIEHVAIFDQFWGTYYIPEKRIYNYLTRHPQEEHYQQILERVKQYNKSRKRNEKNG